MTARATCEVCTGPALLGNVRCLRCWRVWWARVQLRARAAHAESAGSEAKP